MANETLTSAEWEARHWEPIVGYACWCGRGVFLRSVINHPLAPFGYEGPYTMLQCSGCGTRHAKPSKEYEGIESASAPIYLEVAP
jgi:hypothetical protein